MRRMDALLDTVAAHQDFLGPLVLFLSAALEYLFPPFPGDTVTLFGAFLVSARGWSLPLVLATVTAGSLVGATLDYWLGTWLAKKEEGGWQRRGLWSKIIPDHERLRDLQRRFARHGAAFIAVNRFLPGLRAFFFVAAGMAGMRLRAVLFWGGLSALAWNLLIVLLGMGLGASFEELQQLARQYAIGVWILIAVVIAGLCLRAWIRRDDPEQR